MSQEKISYLISFGPPSKRKSPVSCLMRKSHVSREKLMSYQFLVPPNEKISCLLSHEKISCSKRKTHVFSVLVSPLTRKSPVTCLMRKSHVSRENLMSYLFGPNPQQENLLSPVSKENLLSHEKFSCLMLSL